MPAETSSSSSSSMQLDPILNKLAEAVTASDNAESLVRPLLELLESVTGLESTYLTTVDLANQLQNIVYARNTRTLNIPEGLSVPWDDTLCKRALEDGHFYVMDADVRWYDSTAARTLGIATYLSVPVHVAGQLYGTLCGASSARVEIVPESQRLLTMFAQLIARQIERDQLITKLRDENLAFSRYALSDPLTGIPNRRALLSELSRALANAARSGLAVHVAFLDLDGFKAINDRYGHDAGDRFLVQIANALLGGMREGDFVARHGGDEFVMFGTSTRDQESASRTAIRARLEQLTTGRFSIGDQALDYAGPSIGIVTAHPDERDCEALLARADAAMYEVKKQRTRASR